MRCEDYASTCYYDDDIRAMTHMFYSFLTLDKTPNPDMPRPANWDGQAIYESMTQADVLEVMRGPGEYNW